jgi:hypothetical protein
MVFLRWLVLVDLVLVMLEGGTIRQVMAQKHGLIVANGGTVSPFQ